MIFKTVSPPPFKLSSTLTATGGWKIVKKRALGQSSELDIVKTDLTLKLNGSIKNQMGRRFPAKTRHFVCIRVVVGRPGSNPPTRGHYVNKK